MINNRYRLMTRQNGTQHVSSVVLTYEEAQEQLHAEVLIHEETGWDVKELYSKYYDDPVIVICTKEDVVRTITIRESGPFNDACPTS